jgi:undecaprenyl-phosphate 4-deoxy-4-formamido-L-arabinose transferase
MIDPTLREDNIASGLSIVIPVFNSADILPALVSRLATVLTGLGGDYEVILINDGSRDSSWEVIRQLAGHHPWLRGIRMMRNYGQHNAILAGIRAARYEWTVTMDDDLQHPPEELPRLLAKAAEGFDVVYGTPDSETHGLLRDLASIITKVALQSAMGTEVARMVSAFRAFRTRLRDAFAAYHSPFVNIDVLLTWSSTRFAAVRVRHDIRKIGKSNYNFAKLTRHALNMMTGFSVIPLQLGSIIGFGFTLFGILVLLYVLGRYLISGSSIAGFPFLASIIAIFSGAQLFALGIMGEYLARIHFRTMEKPTYAILDVT